MTYLPRLLVRIATPLLLFLLVACGGTSPSNTQADSDGDGIANALDLCPDTREGWTVDSDGCDLDSDDDSINDAFDDCPSTPNNETANANGCSESQRDTDNDGVNDDIDACPGTSPGIDVGADGCPSNDPGADADADGVSDASDVCPDTQAGLDVHASGCPRVTTSRSGHSYDVYLTSNLDDGARIAFTIHEPHNLDTSTEIPIILHSHGYAGARADVAQRPADDGDSLFAIFLRNQYGYLSLDERGHGESGGFIRVLDPDFEGQDWLQVLDWIETNVDWLQFRDDGFGINPVMGAVGGSYGGGFQHLIYRIDEQDRLDAMAPDITWHDLRYSLASDNVFKTYWGTLLSAGGSAAGNGQDPEVNAGLSSGLSTGALPANSLELLYNNSIASNCEGAPGTRALRRIDVFYTQSDRDTLFNQNEMVRNVECVAALGGDVRAWIKPSGHSGGDHGRCGALFDHLAIFSFMEEKLKLKAGAADYAPRYCYNIDNGDFGVITDQLLIGGPVNASFSQDNFQVGEGLDATNGPTPLSLYSVPEGQQQILTGIPTATLTIHDAILGDSLGAEQIDAGPILFLGISVKRAGESTWSTQLGQVRPLRGYFTDRELRLIGVSAELNAGDEVGVMLWPAHGTGVSSQSGGSEIGQYINSGSDNPFNINISGNINLPIYSRDEFAIPPTHPAVE